MTENELRIGNTVLYKGAIVELDAKDFIQLAEDIEDGLIKPIPLTEEWLLKLGLKVKCTPGYYSKGINRECYIAKNPHGFFFVFDEFEDDEGHYEGERSLKLNIKYIHQLQNLYFTLTEKELTINK